MSEHKIPPEKRKALGLVGVTQRQRAQRAVDRLHRRMALRAMHARRAPDWTAQPKEAP